MPKQPLFPHVPKKKEPLFPHSPMKQTPGSTPLPSAETPRYFWVETNPEGTWAIVEAFPEGTIRSPFKTSAEAVRREHDIAAEYGWHLKQVPSPQEKFPKQHEILKKLYPYDFIEYHDDGDLTLQLLIPKPKPQVGFKKGDMVVVTTDGHTFRESELLAFTKSADLEYLPQVLEDLNKNVCQDFRAVRSVVMKHTWELMEKEKLPFRTAIKRSWDEVKKQCLKLGAVI